MEVPVPGWQSVDGTGFGDLLAIPPPAVGAFEGLHVPGFARNMYSSSQLI